MCPRLFLVPSNPETSDKLCQQLPFPSRRCRQRPPLINLQLEAPHSLTVLSGTPPSPQSTILGIGQLQQAAGYQSTARIKEYPRTIPPSFEKPRRLVQQSVDEIPQHILPPLERWFPPLAFRLSRCDQLRPARKCPRACNSERSAKSTRGLNQVMDGLGYALKQAIRLITSENRGRNRQPRRKGDLIRP